MSNIITNAASSGVKIDKRHLKFLARRSNRPGLIYLAAWAGVMVFTGFLVWFSLGTLYIWPAMFIYGVFMSVPSYSLSHETAHGTAFRTRRLNEAVFWFMSLLYGEEPLHRRYTHTNHHTYTWYVGLDSQMPFDTPLDFKGWFYDISGLSILKFQIRVLWQLATKQYTELMLSVTPKAELPKLTSQRTNILSHLLEYRWFDCRWLHMATLVLRAATLSWSSHYVDVQHYSARRTAGKLTLSNG